MASHELDIDPQHLVEWLRHHPEGLILSITRELAPDPDPAPPDVGREAAPAAAMAILEIGPADSGARWRITATARDLSGAHVPEDGSSPEGPVEIGLDAFEAEFLADGNSDVFVTAEYDDSNGKRRFERAYARMLSL